MNSVKLNARDSVQIHLDEDKMDSCKWMLVVESIITDSKGQLTNRFGDADRGSLKIPTSAAECYPNRIV